MYLSHISNYGEKNYLQPLRFAHLNKPIFIQKRIHTVAALTFLSITLSSVIPT